MEIKNRIASLLDWKQKGKDLKNLGLSVWSYVIFLLVLLVYVIRGLLRKLMVMRWIGKLFVKIKLEVVVKKLTDLMYWLDKNEDGGVTRSYLIELAFRNMKSKKNRSVVTIGGVALGVGAIVFLVSIGYGLEKLVIGRVASLDELKMTDVSLGQAVSVKLNDKVIDEVKSMSEVSDAIPMVSMVAKIKFNNSVLDVMSFGVDKRYIDAVNPSFLKGDKFEDKDIGYVYSDSEVNQVLGESQEIIRVDKSVKVGGDVIEFNPEEGERVPVWENCETEGDILGYVIRNEGGYMGEYVWGESYLNKNEKEIYIDDESGEGVAKWIRAKVSLWSLNSDGKVVPKFDSNGVQVWVIGCLKPEGLIINRTEGKYEGMTLDSMLNLGEVLGEATASAGVIKTASGSAEATASAELFEGEVVTDASGVEWVEFKNQTSDINAVKEVQFAGTVVGEAYVSTGMLKLLGLKNEEALGKSFTVSYTVPDGSISGVNGRLQSAETDYKIKGIIDDDGSNYYYYQLADAKRLGISVYSQLKVLVTGKDGLAGVRKRIEALGLRTDSTADTVAQIESLFKTLRVILAALGTIALAVASLGMFNTMTVSLLERTREVGVMKTMGMLSNEVKELFLAESMIMGVGGGVLGILLGFLLGKILSLILSSISLFKGQGLIDVTYIPAFFTIFILLVSFLVGMVTGWYPSKRAKKISALNALRYE
jgi:ABC-type lipoprotein release transport system permease subunit